MDARFYNSEKLDVERLTKDLENVYRLQGYQVQQLGSNEQKLVQLKKGGDLEALVEKTDAPVDFAQTALAVNVIGVFRAVAVRRRP